MASEDAQRINAETLAEAVASFTALADAYAKSDRSELAGDGEAAEVVRSIVASLEAFARKRRARDAERARNALGNALRTVYERVLSGGDGPESEAPQSRRTWHEGMWRTDDERRAAITRMVARCLPALAQDETLAATADLPAERIEAQGGARKAAEAVVAALFERHRSDETSASLSGANVFGLPLP